MKDSNKKEFTGKLVIDESGNLFFEIHGNATILGRFENKFNPSTRMESRRRLEQALQGIPDNL